MTDDSLLPFDLPNVQRKKVSAAFDGGLVSFDGGLVLLREAERRLRLAETLAGCIRDRRNQAQVVHALPAMLRFRMLAIACGGACPRAGRSRSRGKMPTTATRCARTLCSSWRQERRRRAGARSARSPP